jgi:hypothetical protein
MHARMLLHARACAPSPARTASPPPPTPQVRRSAFKDVVKASDIVRFGCDINGIQQYTLNGSKVLYLNREAAPDRKAQPTAAAPAMCVVDGRGMMDKSSQYCSLKCKMHGEDPDFTVWLDAQDPSVKEAAYAAATAPPRPTVACKRAAPNGCPYSYGSGCGASSGSASPASSGGSGGACDAAVGGSSARSRKAPRHPASEASGPGSAGAAPPKHVVIRMPAAVAAMRAKQPHFEYSAACGASAPAAATGRHHNAFLAAATDGPVLGGGWMGGNELDNALSCTTEWGSSASEACDWAAAGDWAAAAPPPAAAAADAAPSPAYAADWWLASCGAPGPANAADAAPALPPLSLGGADDAALDDHAGLLVEWPACAAPLGGGAGELLGYGMATSPGSECAFEGAMMWT